MKVAVVGAGASGLMVSGFLANSGHDVFVFDRNEKVGKKLYISGKGRCNLTNLCSPDEFLKNVVRGEKFVKSAIYNFTSSDAVEFFENLGLETKVERGNRVFPKSDKSSDVIKVLKEKHCKNVNFCFNTKIDSISKTEEGFVLHFDGKKELFDRVIVATGGKSYRSTGSDGDGFKFAKMFGHKVVECVPALCPIKIKDKFVKTLQGVSLKNVTLKCSFGDKKKEFFGEMLFTDDGISGPIVLSLSSFINREKDVSLAIDFKPALNEKQLDARLLRDFEENKNSEIKTVFRGLLPKAVAQVFESVVKIDGSQNVNTITKLQRNDIIKFLKNFPLEYGGLYDLDAGIVTSGGVDLNEINPKTFESKLQKGLYFVGEVLDVDALTGGFNLQLAWAESFMCAKNFS